MLHAHGCKNVSEKNSASSMLKTSSGKFVTVCILMNSTDLEVNFRLQRVNLLCDLLCINFEKE